MQVKTYEYDDLRNTEYRGEKEYKFEFIADIAGDNIDIFNSLDNHDVSYKLQEKKVLNQNSKEDPESCCYYVYFKSREDGMGFIDRLNKYIGEKARLLRAANAF